MKSWIAKSLFAFGLILILLFCVFPVLWALSTSFKSGADLFNTNLWPANFSLDNYGQAFRGQPFGRNILNSVIVASASAFTSIVLGMVIAYALATKEFKGRQLLLYSFLMVSMFPQIAILSGLFELLRTLGLYNSWAGLALSYLTFTLPFTVWVLTAFMREIPRAIEEAALMDGAKPWRIIFSIFFPIMAPSIVTTFLLSFIAAWNEFLFALTFTFSNRARTIPVAMSLMSGASAHELPWGQLMAAAVVVTLPILLLVFIFQRRMIVGLTAGALKG